MEAMDHRARENRRRDHALPTSGVLLLALVACASSPRAQQQPPEPKVVVAPPPSPPARVTVADIVERMRTTHFTHGGTIEALAIPQTGSGAVRTTRWGTIRRAPASPTTVHADHFGPAWLATRVGDASRDVVLDKPRILEITLVQGISTGDDPRAIRAGQSGGLLAATWRQLDGTPPITLDVGAALDDAAARWKLHADAHRAAIDTELSAMLDNKVAPDRARFSSPETSDDLSFTPTWDPDRDRLISRYASTVQRTIREQRGKLQRDCPYNRPESFCRDVEVKRGWTATARLAVEVVYDRTGKLVDVTTIAPELNVQEAP